MSAMESTATTINIITYELRAEVNYYRRFKKRCIGTQAPNKGTPISMPHENPLDCNSFFDDVGENVLEPTLIFYLEKQHYDSAYMSARHQISGHFLAIHTGGDFARVGKGGSNGEITSGLSEVDLYNDVTGSFPRIAYQGDFDYGSDSYDMSDFQCWAPRPVIGWTTGMKIGDASSSYNDWENLRTLTCEDNFNHHIVWSNTSVYSGFDSYVKEQLGNDWRLADLADVFGTGHIINSSSMTGNVLSHTGDHGDGVGDFTWFYTGRNMGTMDGSPEARNHVGTGAFHYYDPYWQEYNHFPGGAHTATGDDFHYVGTKFLHNDWAHSIQGCLDRDHQLGQARVSYIYRAPYYSTTTMIWPSRFYDNPVSGNEDSYYSSYPSYPTETGRQNYGVWSAAYRSHFWLFSNDGFLAKHKGKTFDHSVCQKIKTVSEQRGMELNSSLTGKMVDLFVKAYKDYRPTDITVSQTTGDIVEWLINPTGFYNCSKENYEGSRCCDGENKRDFFEHPGPGYGAGVKYDCTLPLSGKVNGAYGVGCYRSGVSPTIYFQQCTGQIKSMVSGGLYWLDADHTGVDKTGSHFLAYSTEIFHTGTSLGKESGDTHTSMTPALQNSNWVKTGLKDNYSGVFKYILFWTGCAESDAGQYMITCPGQWNNRECYYGNRRLNFYCNPTNQSGYRSEYEWKSTEEGNPDTATWGEAGYPYLLNFQVITEGYGGGGFQDKKFCKECCDGADGVLFSGTHPATDRISGMDWSPTPLPTGLGFGCDSDSPDATLTGSSIDGCLPLYSGYIAPATGNNLQSGYGWDSFTWYHNYAGLEIPAVGNTIYIEDCDHCYSNFSAIDNLPYPVGIATHCNYHVLKKISSSPEIWRWYRYKRTSANQGYDFGTPIAKGPSGSSN